MMTMTMILLYFMVTVIVALPFADVHVKFVSPPNIYEHSITTDGDRTLSQKSFISIGRKNTIKHFGNLDYTYGINSQQYPLQQTTATTNHGNAEFLWPIGDSLPALNELGYNWQKAQRRISDLYKSSEKDPYLLTGDQAAMAVKYLYGMGELFYDYFPHIRALLRNQEERRLNGLHTHVLASLNPKSPFHRKY